MTKVEYGSTGLEWRLRLPAFGSGKPAEVALARAMVRGTTTRVHAVALRDVARYASGPAGSLVASGFLTPSFTIEHDQPHGGIALSTDGVGVQCIAIAEHAGCRAISHLTLDHRGSISGMGLMCGYYGTDGLSLSLDAIKLYECDNGSSGGVEPEPATLVFSGGVEVEPATLFSRFLGPEDAAAATKSIRQFLAGWAVDANFMLAKPAHQDVTLAISRFSTAKTFLLGSASKAQQPRLHVLAAVEAGNTARIGFVYDSVDMLDWQDPNPASGSSKRTGFCFGSVVGFDPVGRFLKGAIKYFWSSTQASLAVRCTQPVGGGFLVIDPSLDVWHRFNTLQVGLAASRSNARVRLGLHLTCHL